MACGVAPNGPVKRRAATAKGAVNATQPVIFSTDNSPQVGATYGKRSTDDPQGAVLARFKLQSWRSKLTNVMHGRAARGHKVLLPLARSPAGRSQLQGWPLLKQLLCQRRSA